MTLPQFLTINAGDVVTVRSGLITLFCKVADIRLVSSQVKVLVPNIPTGSGWTEHWLSYKQVELV